MPWIVISTYYKHGEYNVEFFKTKDDLENYLVEILVGYDMGYNYDHTYSFKKLVKRAIEGGEYIVDNQLGTGIREIIHVGDKITSYNIDNLSGEKKL